MDGCSLYIALVCVRRHLLIWLADGPAALDDSVERELLDYCFENNNTIIFQEHPTFSNNSAGATLSASYSSAQLPPQNLHPLASSTFSANVPSLVSIAQPPSPRLQWEKFVG